MWHSSTLGLVCGCIITQSTPLNSPAFVGPFLGSWALFDLTLPLAAFLQPSNWSKFPWSSVPRASSFIVRHLHPIFFVPSSPSRLHLHASSADHHLPLCSLRHSVCSASAQPLRVQLLPPFPLLVPYHLRGDWPLHCSTASPHPTALIPVGALPIVAGWYIFFRAFDVSCRSGSTSSHVQCKA